MTLRPDGARPDDQPRPPDPPPFGVQLLQTLPNALISAERVARLRFPDWPDRPIEPDNGD